jgi:hypothetical protein
VFEGMRWSQTLHILRLSSRLKLRGCLNISMDSRVKRDIKSTFAHTTRLNSVCRNSLSHTGTRTSEKARLISSPFLQKVHYIPKIKCKFSLLLIN